tara:strand:+ start:72 stop:224 length:153 start_codon:yes stop_codon:yes gene_type:complete
MDGALPPPPFWLEGRGAATECWVGGQLVVVMGRLGSGPLHTRRRARDEEG